MKKFIELILLVKKELLLCIVIPILTAALLNTGSFYLVDYYFIITIGALCLFTYGVIKMYFKLKKHNADMFAANRPKSIAYRIFIVVIAIILPIIGLLLNENLGGLLGDFSNEWFFIIAISNGLIMLANIDNSKFSLALFYLKTVGFAFITYFTIIFIPLLPVGIHVLMFFGAGVLAYVPLTIFVLEIRQIAQDIKKLKAGVNAKIIVAIMLLGFVTLPSAMFIDFSIDRSNFQKALTYLSDASWDMQTVNITRLNRTLKYIEGVLRARQIDIGLFIYGAGNTPIISKFYQVVALDDKILSSETTRRLSQIFLGISEQRPIRSANGQFDNMSLIKADTSTEYDEELGIYKTWIDLEIKNENNMPLSEYRTEFPLPVGCFIKDYYLYVGNERKQGILADKRAALIIYENIIRTPKDPGIIYYKSDNVIELRVYPFAPSEVRRTGFLVWHSQSEVISIDDWQIYLTAEKSVAEPIDMQGISFIPAALKESLPVSERIQKNYFILDVSENSPYAEHLIKVNQYINKANIKDAKIIAASYKVVDTAVKDAIHQGGFNLPLAMELVFKDIEEYEYPCFPVIIAVSDNIYKAPEFQKSSIAKRYPESEYYYNLGYDLSLTPYSFLDNKRHDIEYSPIISKALNYNGKSVSDRESGEVVISGEFGDYTDNEYQNAFILYGKSLIHNNDNSSQIELVRDSFRQRLLSKYTAFTVLETREQENALLELQAKFLNNEDINVSTVRMDEPGLLICLIMFFAILFYGRKKHWSRQR